MGRHPLGSPGRALVALGLGLALALGGCGIDTRTEDLLGPWVDGAGQQVRYRDGAPFVLRVIRDPDGCGVTGVVVLLLPWPPGTPALADGASEIRQYARDPHARLGESSGARFAADVALPAAAVDTGFASLGNKVFVDPSGDAYVRRPAGQVERWPRLTPDLACISGERPGR